MDRRTSSLGRDQTEVTGDATCCAAPHRRDAVVDDGAVAGAVAGADGPQDAARGGLVREGLRAGCLEHEERRHALLDVPLTVRLHHSRYKDRALVERQTCIRTATTNCESSRRSLGAAEIVGSLLRRVMFPEGRCMLCCLFVFRCNALRVSSVLCIIMLCDIAPVKILCWGKSDSYETNSSTLSVVRDADPRICGMLAIWIMDERDSKFQRLSQWDMLSHYKNRPKISLTQCIDYP